MRKTTYVCFDCKKEFESIKKCKECGVKLCDKCYERGEKGICEECGYESDGMY